MSSGEEPLYMPPGEARLWQALLAVAQELSVARDRIDLLERALEARNLLASGELEALALDADAQAERAAARTSLVDRVIAPMRNPTPS